MGSSTGWRHGRLGRGRALSTALRRPFSYLDTSGRIIMSELHGFRVAVLATHGVEESELTRPVKALRDAGAVVTIVSLAPGRIQAVEHDLEKTAKIPVDRTIEDVSDLDFDAVHLPGGTVNADS